MLFSNTRLTYVSSNRPVSCSETLADSERQANVAFAINTMRYYRTQVVAYSNLTSQSRM